MATKTKQQTKGGGRLPSNRELQEAVAKDKASAGISGNGRKAGRKKSKYPGQIIEAAVRVRELLGGHAPGPKQILATEKALDGRDPVEVAGLSLATLTKWAKGGDAPKKRDGVREITRVVGDPYVVGRRAAAILVALAEQSKGD